MPGATSLAATAASEAARSANEAASAAKATADALAWIIGEGVPIDDGRHLVLDYPIHPRPRFGHEHPSHPQVDAIIRARVDHYRKHLEAIVAMLPWLAKIPVDDPGDPTTPFWFNPWLPGLDAAALYTIVASEKPTTYLEVGSGTSTKFTRRAISDHGLSTRIVSIDPQPRAEIDAICDEVIRSRLEEADLSVFDSLVAGDVVFIDNSHRVFTNSDACVVFLEVLPRLAPGVLVEIHDIYLPDDYPAGWNDRFYSEQYVLAGYLLGGSQTFETELPNWFVTTNPELAEIVAPLWDELPGAEPTGGSYWLRMT
jgi:hypothetical protein